MDQTRSEIRAVIEHMVEIMNTHDVDGCVSCYAEDAELQDPRFPSPVRGANYVHEGFTYWYNAFPDVKIEITRFIIEPPDVAIEWTFEATHLGEYMGIEPSGKTFSVMTAAHFSVERGKVTRDFSLFDATGIRLLEELAGSSAGTER
jgi:steroid delta-isomerase-like uncharacterized protein